MVVSHYRRLPWVTILLVCLGGLTPFVSPVNGAEARSGYYSKVAALANRASVGLYCTKGDLMSYYGTGVIISRDGYILTSTTVTPPGAKNIQVYLSNQKIYKGTLVEYNEAAESALIKILPDGLLTAVPLAPNLPTIGERAYTLGNAHNMLRTGREGSFSVGIISGLYGVESTDTQSSYNGLAIETDAAINPGQDGGMVLNSAGQLVGIVSLSYSMSRWQGVAVPISKICESLPTLRNGLIKTSEKPVLKPLPGDSPNSLGIIGAARGLARSVVLLDVEREYPAEVIPRTPMNEYLESIPDEVPLITKQAMMQTYSRTDRLLATNQQIRRPDALTSGVIVSPDGYILTSLFNVKTDEAWFSEGEVKLPDLENGLEAADDTNDYSRGYNEVKAVHVLLPDGTRAKATIVARHFPLGIALLKVEADGLPHIKFDRAAEWIHVGDRCAVIGAQVQPYGYTLNSGMVSAVNRYRKRRFQFDAIINYGNSGGLVVDGNGRVLGLALMPMQPGPTMGRIFSGSELLRWQIGPNSGVSIAAKAGRIAQALPFMMAGKSTEKLPGAFVGISPDSKHVLGNQVRLAVVQPGSPADKAGIRVGDILKSFNGRPVSSWKDLTDALDDLESGDTITVEVLRHRASLTATDKPSGLPDGRDPGRTLIFELTLGKRL